MSEKTKELGRPNRRLGPARVVLRHGWILVAGWLLLLFYITNYLLPRIRSADLNIYVFQPLLWLSLGALALWLWRRERGDAAFPIDRGLMVMAALVGAFQVAVFVLAGLLAGFGNSPYARRFPLIILNLWFVGTWLAGLELARWYLVVSLGRRNTWLGVGVAWLLLSLVTVPAASFGQIVELQKAFPLVGRIFLPTVSENLLATYLVLIGGPLASIAYRGVLAAFEWLSPILPSLSWLIIALLGTLAPALGLLVIHNRYAPEPAAEEEAQSQKSGVSSLWLLVAVMAVGLVWFTTGAFGVRPSLVSGISMNPTLLLGDVVVTQEVSPEAVEVGEIIRFRQENSSIVHRVKEIQKDESGIRFICRGDNNNTDDPPVDPSQLQGRVIFVVPKIGWVSIGARKLMDWMGIG